MKEPTTNENFRLGASWAKRAAAIAKRREEPKATFYRSQIEAAIDRLDDGVIEEYRDAFVRLVPDLALLASDDHDPRITFRYEPDNPNLDTLPQEDRRLFLSVAGVAVPKELVTPETFGTTSKPGGVRHRVLYLQHPAGPMAFIGRVQSRIPAEVSVPIRRLPDLVFVDANAV